MKNPFTQPTFNNNKSRVLMLMSAILLVFNTFVIGKKNDSNESAKKILPPPPVPTVVVTLPSGANCYSSLTASGCDAGNTVYWFQNGNSYYYSTGATVTAGSPAPTYFTAKCYDNVTATYGSASVEYKVFPAGYTELSPKTTQTLCAGVTSILFNASSATSGLTYQWRKGFLNISGATGSSYTATATDYYDVVATSGSCTFTSPYVQVVNATAPVITSLVTGTCGSKTLNLYVYNVAGGTFQWKLNGTNISGATAYNYSVPISSAAGSYTVEYTSGACVSISAPFVYAQPTIVLTPATSPACNATLTATGCSSNTYWYKYNGSNWVYENYTNSSTYNFPVSAVASDYKASCDVSTSTYCAETASNSVTAIPTNYSTISPASGNICGTGSALLTASSTFAGVTFQWQKNGVNISGATGATYSATTAGNYGVVATTGSCSFTSGVSTVTVITPPVPPTSITKNPNTSVNPGTSVTLTASACPSGSTFKWEDNSTANPRVIAPSATTTYSVKCVSGTCESATSTSTTVTVLATITITSPTPSAEFCSNGGTIIPVTFTTTGTLTGNYTVTLSQTKTFIGSTSYTNDIVTMTTATNSVNLTLPSNQESSGNNRNNYTVSYGILVRNGTISSFNYIGLNPRADITISTTGTCGSQTATLTSQSFYVTGTFQWKKNGVNVGPAIVGSTSGYTTPTYTTTDNGTYTLEYTDNICTTTSNAIVFAQNAAPSIALATSSCTNYLTATGCTGGTITWYVNSGGSWVNQSTGTNYYFSSRGDYRATCTSNGCTSIPSNVVTGLPYNFTEIIPSNPSICSIGGSITLNASSASSGLTYQWKLNGSNISGATNPSYNATAGGSYSVTAINGLCNYTSMATNVSTTTAPIIGITSTTSSPTTITNGQSLTLTANGCTSSGGTILWSPGGATTNTLVVSPSSSTTYTFTCTKTPCVITSNPFIVNVNALLPPTITSSSVSTCTGTSVTITGVCPNSSAISWNTSPIQTTSVITISPSITTSYVATCTLGAATSTGSISIGVFNGAITSLSSGNWTDANTWSCNCIPASCNDVIVDTGHNVIIPASLTGKLKNLTIRGTVDVKNTGTMALK